MKKTTLRQLQIFCEVARHLSFARAAEALHLTPPAVSMQIKELEASAGLPLFDRQGRKIALTTAGEYMLVYARRMLTTLVDAEDMMARLKGMEAGALDVGLVSTAKYFLPRLLTGFREEHPGVEIRLRVCANRDELVALLRDSEIDLAIMGRPPREFATRAEAFAAHPHVFVGPPGHELVQKSRVPAGSLEAFPFIVREPGSGTRKHMIDFFHTHHLAPRVAMEMQSNESIKQAVMAGMGLSFLSLHTIGLEAQNGLIEVLPIKGTPIVRTWNVVHLAGKVLPPAAEAMRYYILENFEARLADHDRALLGRSGAGRRETDGRVPPAAAGVRPPRSRGSAAGSRS